METADLAVIGGGIVGLSTAYEFQRRFPGKPLVVLEKEDQLARHQTGNNSGVLHSGIYYKPGSLKALNCRTGKQAMEEFCAAQGIPYEICGKVIVAVDEHEIPALETIYARGCANGVQCRIIAAEELAEREPHVSGVRAIHVPETGIVNFRRVCERLGELVGEAGGRIVTGARVQGIERDGSRRILQTSAGEYSARLIVNCAGLQSDRVARLTGAHPEARIVPFRGEYYDLKPEAQHLCRDLIYPVPNPDFPFLGVHFTRMIEGGVECGPNAVFAFAREGYSKLTINLRDLTESLTYGGFLKLAARYWRVGAGEMWRSFSKAAFVRALQRLVPEICAENLVRSRTGVRAQAISPTGEMVDDFAIDEGVGVVNVCNAPSPAATSALNIGRIVVERLAAHLAD